MLDLWAGLRHLLAARAESIAGVELITNEAVSLRPASQAGTTGNQAGEHGGAAAHLGSLTLSVGSP